MPVRRTRPAGRHRPRRSGGGVGASSWSSWSLHSLVFDQAQVDGVLAVFTLEDAYRRRHAVRDPEDGFVVAAVGAFDPHRLVAQFGDADRFGLSGDPVFVVAHPAA